MFKKYKFLNYSKTPDKHFTYSHLLKVVHLQKINQIESSRI